MHTFDPYVIKSFKHNGHLHRMWMENWLVPEAYLVSEHREEGMIVLINSQTRIVEANGKEWTSRVPGVSIFIPNQWYNIVALLEDQGMRYYCNVDSPPYRSYDTITYIDYDLDVIITALPDRQIILVDHDEYELHKHIYRYSSTVEQKVKEGLDGLMTRSRNRMPPIQDEVLWHYYELWNRQQDEEQ